MSPPDAPPNAPPTPSQSTPTGPPFDDTHPAPFGRLERVLLLEPLAAGRVARALDGDRRCEVGAVSSQSPAFTDLWAFEVWMHGRLVEKEVAPLLTQGTVGDMLVVVRERRAGLVWADLVARLHRHGVPSLGMCLYVARGLARALLVADAGVRRAGVEDLLPLLALPDEAVLGYDGALSLVPSPSSRALVGAPPRYMVPGQITGARAASEPAFLVAGSLIELLVGKHPFDFGGTASEVLARIVERRWRRPSAVRGEVPPDVELFLERCFSSTAKVDLERELAKLADAHDPIDARHAASTVRELAPGAHEAEEAFWEEALIIAPDDAPPLPFVTRAHHASRDAYKRARR